jgi:hypothetical protein
MTDNFEKDELKGRQKLKQDYEQSPYKIVYQFTPGKYDKLDCFSTAYTPNKDITYANEIKNREILIDSYAKDGFIMEKNKYEALMEAYTQSGYTPLYINYFNDGRIVWDVTTLHNVEQRWEWKWCTETTAENYRKKMVLKEVILLYPQEGKVRRTITE